MCLVGVGVCVLWVSCGCLVGVLWVSCGCLVGVLWVYLVGVSCGSGCVDCVCLHCVCVWMCMRVCLCLGFSLTMMAFCNLVIHLIRFIFLYIFSFLNGS